jgi:hypothetical protein
MVAGHQIFLIELQPEFPRMASVSGHDGAPRGAVRQPESSPEVWSGQRERWGPSRGSDLVPPTGVADLWRMALPSRWRLRCSLGQAATGRYVTFQLTEVTVPRALFAETCVLRRIGCEARSVAHQPRADLDQHLAQGRQRPLRDRVR